MHRRQAIGIAALILVACASAWAGSRVASFAADFTTTTNGKPTATGSVCVQDKNVREDKRAGPRLSVMILNWKAKKQWTLDPDMKVFWELPVTEASYQLRLDALRGATPAGLGGDLKRLGFRTRKLGTERVRGYPCEKSEIRGPGIRTTLWFSKTLDWPLRTETAVTVGKKTTTYRTEYRNIKQTALPASRFEVPRSYRKIPPPLSEQ